MPGVQVIKLEAENPDAEALARAARRLSDGGVIVIPTDTVYGLVCDPRNEAAVARVYDIKGRPRELPLTLLVASAEDLDRFCAVVPDSARRAAEAFWPGPLTIVLPRSQAVFPALTAGRPTIGLRLPDHAVPRDLIRLTGFPLASTSANLSGQPAARSGAAARAALGEQVDLILDSGPAPLGLESTVADFGLSPPKILRQGAISPEQLL